MAITNRQIRAYQETAQEFLGNAAEQGKELYETAKEWLPENYTNPWVIGSGIAAAGLLGFILGRASSGEKERKGFSIRDDGDRLMKFARFWLLYRATL